MSGIYDKIKQIKREGSEYDKLMTEHPDKFMADGIDMRTVNTASRATNQNIFVGDRPELEGFGDSKYDTSIGTQDLDYRSLEDIRAEAQGWIPQFTNNLINTATIAGTTYASSFIGTVAGIINVIFNPDPEGLDKEELKNLSWWDRASNNFANNDIDLYLNSINKAVKKWAPTYTTDEYRANRENGQWYKNIFSSEFLGEVLIENFGFMMGAGAAGKTSAVLMSNLLKSSQKLNLVKKAVDSQIKSGAFVGTADEGLMAALNGRLPIKGLSGDLQKAVSGIKRDGAITNAVSTVLSTTGEAKIEAINSTDAYRESQMAALHGIEGQTELMNKTIYSLYASNPDLFVGNPLEGNPLDAIAPGALEIVQGKYQENLAKAEKEIELGAARVASFTLAANFPVLLASNAVAFGRQFRGSYATNKSFRKSLEEGLTGTRDPKMAGAGRVVKEGGKYVVKQAPKYKEAYKILRRPFMEGGEEMMQASGEAGANIYAETLMGIDRDPSATATVLDNINAAFKGIVQTWSDPAAYEEFFAGFVTGGLGAPNISMAKNNDNKRTVFDGGVWSDIKGIKSENAELQAAVDAINERVSQKDFQLQLTSMVGRQVLEEVKQGALGEGDKVTYENADHIQFIKDLMMFDKLGKTQDFIDMLDGNIERYSNYSSEQEMKALADELKEAGNSMEVEGANLFGNKIESQILQDVVNYNKELKENVKLYLEISRNLREVIGDKFQEDEEMSEMILMFSQIDNLEKRYDTSHTRLSELVKDVKSTVFRDKKFDIYLQGSIQSLTFDEIVNLASPSELMRFIAGEYKNPQQKQEYLKDLMETHVRIQDEVARLESTTGNIIQKIWGKADPKNPTRTSAKINKVHKRAAKKAEEKRAEMERAIEDAKTKISELSKVLDKTPHRAEILSLVNDMIRIENTRENLTNAYNSYIGAEQLARKIEADKATANDVETTNLNKEISKKLAEATTMEQLREIIDTQENSSGTIHESVFQKLGNPDNAETTGYSPLVAEYNAVNNLEKSIRQHLNSLPNIESQDWFIKATGELWNSIRRNVNTLQEAFDYTPTLIKDGGEIVSLPDSKSKQQVIDSYIDMMEDIRTKNSAYKNLKGKTTINPNNSPQKASPINAKKNEGVRQHGVKGTPIKNTTEIDTSKYGTPGEEVELSIGKKKDDVQSDIVSGVPNKKGVNQDIVDTPDQKVPVINGKNTIIPSLAELDLGYYNHTGKFRDNVMFPNSWEWMKDQGVWDYLNNGNLKKGDKVKLVFSRDYYEDMKNKVDISDSNQRTYWSKNFPLLWVKEDVNGKLNIDGTSYQVVGTYDHKADPNYQNLQSMMYGKLSEYNDHIFGETTVVHVTDGRIAIDKENPGNIADRLSPPITQSPKDIKFGVSMGQGKLDFNKVDVGDVKELDTKNDDAGRLYVLIPGAASRSLPMAMGVKTFEEMYNDESSKLHNFEGDFFGQLKVGLENVIKSIHIADGRYSKNLKAENDALAKELGNISTLLFVGQKQGIPFYLNARKEHGGTEIYLKIGKSSELSIGNIGVNGKSSIRPTDALFNDLVKLLASPELGIKFSINKNKLNTEWTDLGKITNPSYNEALIESGLLYSDIAKYNVRGTNFEMNPIAADPNKKDSYTEQEVIAKPPKAPVPEGSSTLPVKPQDLGITIGNDTWMTAENGDLFNRDNPSKIHAVNSKGYVYIIAMDRVNKLSQEEQDAITVPVSEIKGLKGAQFLTMGIDNVYLYTTPSGSELILGNTASVDKRFIKAAKDYLDNKKAGNTNTTVNTSNTTSNDNNEDAPAVQIPTPEVSRPVRSSRRRGGIKAANLQNDANFNKDEVGGKNSTMDKKALDEIVRKEKEDLDNHCGKGNAPRFGKFGDEPTF